MSIQKLAGRTLRRAKAAFLPSRQEVAIVRTVTTAAVAGLGAIVILVAIWMGQSPSEQRKARHWVDHTLTVLTETDRLTTDLATIASEGRGFMIDQTADSKARFEAAIGRAQAKLPTIRALTADNPDQQRALDRLEPLFVERVNLLRRIISLIESGDSPAAIRIMQTQQGRAINDQIIATVEAMRQEEKRLLDQRTGEAQWAADRMTISLAGCGTLIIIAVVFAIFLHLGRRREHRHIRQLNAINAELEQRVERRTERLAESEALFRILAERSSDMVSQVDQNGHRVYLSPIAERIFGHPSEMLRQSRLTDFIHPDDRKQIIALQSRLLDQNIDEDRTIFRVDHPERGTVWAEVYARALRCDATGASGGYVSVTRDITERRLAEEARIVSEARYRLLADNASDVIKCVDRDGVVLYISPSVRAVLGQEPGDIIGTKLTANIHPGDIDRVLELMRALMQDTTDKTVTSYRKRHKDGRWLWVEATFGLARDPASGQPTSFVIALRDITERQRAADDLRAANAELERLARHLTKARDGAEKANRAKSRFLAGMSHELRTPLNGILGYAQLLKIEGDLSDKQAERVDAMLGAGNHLLEMINGVLALSEIEAEKVELNATKVNLRELAASCLDLVRPAAHAKALGNCLIVADDVPDRLTVDATRLRQILLNLLGNAVKFTSKGQVELRVCRAVPGLLRFEVADTGPGIPPAQKHRLFQDFERLQASGLFEIEGTGLGLALSSGLAAILGGRLGHDDNHPRGSVFWLELPLTDADLAVESVLPVEHEADRTLQPARRVLVVDDVLINRDIAASIVTAAGHEVVLVESGKEAVELAAHEDFDVVLMDVRMPEMDGLEATRRIRALPGPRGQVPIVALTAQAFAEQVRECRRAGMHDHLSKPFDHAALIRAVEAEYRTGTPASEARRAGPEPSAMFNRNAFAKSAALMSPGTLRSYLQTLIDRCNELNGKLGAAEMGDLPDDFADCCHTLAGSAAIFGFEHLATSAAAFENGLERPAVEVAASVPPLRSCLTVSVAEMRRCLVAVAEAG